MLEVETLFSAFSALVAGPPMAGLVRWYGHKIAARFSNSGCAAGFYYEININWFQGNRKPAGFD